MAWLSVMLIFMISITSLYKHYEEDNPYFLLLNAPLVTAMFCKNGRRLVGRGISEGFYGILYTFTGVAYDHNGSSIEN